MNERTIHASRSINNLSAKSKCSLGYSLSLCIYILYKYFYAFMTKIRKRELNFIQLEIKINDELQSTDTFNSLIFFFWGG